MELCEKFEKAKQFYFSVWKVDRLCIINELTVIRDELQSQELIQTIGNITYSGVGLVGGGLFVAGIKAAPFTLGLSLILTIGGAATGIMAGVAGVTHSFVKLRIIKSKCNKAIELIKEHEKKTEKLTGLLRDLELEIQLMKNSLNGNEALIKEGVKKITHGVVGVGLQTKTLVTNAIAWNTLKVSGNSDKVAKILGLNSVLKKVVPSVLQNVTGGVAKLSSTALGILTGVGMLANFVSVVSNAYDLRKISKGNLREHAKQMDDLVNEYERDMEPYIDCFER